MSKDAADWEIQRLRGDLYAARYERDEALRKTELEVIRRKQGYEELLKSREQVRLLQELVGDKERERDEARDEERRLRDVVALAAEELEKRGFAHAAAVVRTQSRGDKPLR